MYDVIIIGAGVTGCAVARYLSRYQGSALVLEFLLHYLTRPEYQLHVREEIYLDNMLDLF